MATRLGVDLGTTWTAAAISEGRADVLQLGTHSLAMPSVVAVEGDLLIVGEAAERRMAADPAAGAREVKRRLGDTTPIVVGGKPFGAETLMAPLLAEAIAKATQQVGGAPDALTLTHPANWGEYKLDLLREIARLAGRDTVDLLPEPAAAALHYAQLGKLNAGDVVAVYDFGGGTFDVAVVRCEADSAAVLGTPNGLERLGGVDLDQIVLQHVDAALDGKLRELDSTKPDVRAAIAQLRIACTTAKEALSTDGDAVVQVNLPDLRTEVRVTRAEFETAVRSRVEDTLGAFDRAVASSGVAVGDLAGVLLVGGSARIPVVAEAIASHTGRPVLVDADAKAVVALGAAGPGAPQAAAAAVAAAAASGKGGREKAGAARGRGERGSAATRVVGAIAGVAATAGVAAAGYAGYQYITDDDGGGGGGDDLAGVGDEAEAVDASMDAFDDLAAAAADGGGGGGFTGGAAMHAGGRGGGSGGADFSDSPAGRVAARMFAPQEAAVGAPRMAQAPPPAAPAAAPVPPVFTDPGVENVRNQLRERLAGLQAPEGADPAAYAEMKADLEGLLDRYQPYPGQSMDDAVASLKYEFDDRVHDFAQDQQLDALLDERTAEQAAEDALNAEVDTFRDQLRERLENWQAPEGASPEAVADMKADLEGMLERFTPIPGQSAEDALADLRGRFNDRVTDFSQDQKIDAVLEELGVETPKPAEGTTVTNADGSTTTTMSDGSTTVKTSDGTETTTAADGTKTVAAPDGSTTTTAPDGTVTTAPAPATGETTTPAADGTTTPAAGTEPTDLTFDPVMARNQGYTDDQVAALQVAHDEGVTVDVGAPGAPTPEGGFDVPTGVITPATAADAVATPQNTGVVPPVILDTFDEDAGLTTAPAAAATQTPLGDPPPPGVQEAFAQSEPITDDALGTAAVTAAAAAPDPRVTTPAATTTTPAATADTPSISAEEQALIDSGAGPDMATQEELDAIDAGIDLPEDDTTIVPDDDFASMPDDTGGMPEDQQDDMADPLL